MNFNLFILILGFLLHKPEEHKIEVYLFDQEDVPIEVLKTTESFFNIWYHYAITVEPKGVPLLTSFDIEKFDADEFTLVLTKSGVDVMSQFEIPVKGIPIQLVIDGKVAYGAWLWNMLSSTWCDGITYMIIGGDTKNLRIMDGSKKGNERRIPKDL